MNGFFKAIHRRKSYIVLPVVTALSLAIPTVPQFASLLLIKPSIAVAQTNDNQANAEQFVDLLFAQRYYEALQYVHPTLRAELSHDNHINEQVQEFKEMAGGFKSRLDATPDGNLVLVNTEFENITDTVIVIFDEQGLITGFDFPVEPLRAAHRQRVLNR